MRRLFLLTLCFGLLAGCTVVQGIEKPPRTKSDVSVTTTLPPLLPTISPANINLVEEGWSDDLPPDCTSNGDCATTEPGYYYRIYESANYPCGEQGNHEFMVIDSDQDATVQRNLFIKFLGGGAGFRYIDDQGQPAYWPDDTSAGILTASQNRRMLIRAGLSQEYAQGVTKRIRETPGWRVLVVSYCSQDLYRGEGEFSSPELNPRWGYSAAMQATIYILANYVTTGFVTYGGSAGAAGAFFIGKNAFADAIVMDSQAVDLAAMRDACNADTNVFGKAYPCFVDGRNSYEILAERIGFELGVDEPYRNLEGAPPIYFVWNEYDASRNAYLQYENLHKVLGNSGAPNVAQKVCIDDPDISGRCNLHVPSGKDLPDTAWLVDDIYAWILGRIDGSTVLVQEASGTVQLETALQTLTKITSTITATAKITPGTTPIPQPTIKPTTKPIPITSNPEWGSMILPSWEGDRISAYDVLLTAEQLGFNGMVATGAPSEENAVRYKALDGWIRVFLRGEYSQLQNIDTVARQMDVPYTHIGYGPESLHQAGEEALDPLKWVPQAEALAESWGKGLVYGPAVMDWEQRIATNVEDRAAIIAKVAPHVDIWMVQLGNYERWARTGKDDAGNAFSWDTLYERVGWWAATIKGANPAADVWVQAGIGQTEGGKCLPPGPVDEFLAYRAKLAAAGVDGLFVMPSQTCQLSTDPADHEAWLQAYEAFEEAVIRSAE